MNCSIKTYFISGSLGLLLLGLAPISQATVIKNQSVDQVPTGKGWGTFSDHPIPRFSDKKIPQNGIFFHGGPVMGTTTSNIPNVYFIWYGNWANNSGVNILTNLVKGMGGSPYYHINSTYQDKNGQPIRPVVNVPIPAGAFDNYSQGKALSDAAIFRVVTTAITNKTLPLDKNGIYFVLTSADVSTSGFCTQYCGWHTMNRFQSTNIKYSFVGNPERCLDACAEQNISPNNNPGADGMASVIAHELEETITDPNLNAWYDEGGAENADKCAWKFGKTQKTPTGAKYNLTINGLRYLIQENWVNDRGGFCALSY